MKKRFTLGIGLAVLSWALVGCGGNGSSSTLPDPTISFLNLVPDSTGLKFVIDDLTIANSHTYLQYNNDWPAIPFRNATSDNGNEYVVSDSSTGEEIERDSSDFQRDTDNLAIAFGKQTPGTELEKRLQQTVIQLNRRIVPGKCRLYLFNAYIPKVGSSLKNINFRNVDPTNPTSTSRPLYGRDNIVFGAFRSDVSVIDIDAGTWTFQARDSDADAVTVLAQKTFTFAKDTIYLAVVGGQEDAATSARQGSIEFLPIATKL